MKVTFVPTLRPETRQRLRVHESVPDLCGFIWLLRTRQFAALFTDQWKTQPGRKVVTRFHCTTGRTLWCGRRFQTDAAVCRGTHETKTVGLCTHAREFSNNIHVQIHSMKWRPYWGLALQWDVISHQKYLWLHEKKRITIGMSKRLKLVWLCCNQWAAPQSSVWLSLRETGSFSCLLWRLTCVTSPPCGMLQIIHDDVISHVLGCAVPNRKVCIILLCRKYEANILHVWTVIYKPLNSLGFPFFITLQPQTSMPFHGILWDKPT